MASSLDVAAGLDSVCLALRTADAFFAALEAFPVAIDAEFVVDSKFAYVFAVDVAIMVIWFKFEL